MTRLQRLKNYLTGKSARGGAHLVAAEIGGSVACATAGMFIGAAIGSVVPIVGTAIGAIVGAALGSFAGRFVGRAAYAYAYSRRHAGSFMEFFTGREVSKSVPEQVIRTTTATATKLTVGATVGAVVGSMAPVVGTLVGALVGAGVGAIAGSVAGGITRSGIGALHTKMQGEQPDEIEMEVVSPDKKYDTDVTQKAVAIDGQVRKMHERITKASSISDLRVTYDACKTLRQQSLVDNALVDGQYRLAALNVRPYTHYCRAIENFNACHSSLHTKAYAFLIQDSGRLFEAFCNTHDPKTISALHAEYQKLAVEYQPYIALWKDMLQEGNLAPKVKTALQRAIDKFEEVGELTKPLRTSSTASANRPVISSSSGPTARVSLGT